MTHKEIAERLRKITDATTPILYGQLTWLADQLDPPPRPSPGTVVPVKVPPVRDWPEQATYIEIFFAARGDDDVLAQNEKGFCTGELMVITRTEAEKREAEG